MTLESDDNPQVYQAKIFLGKQGLEVKVSFDFLTPWSWVYEPHCNSSVYHHHRAFDFCQNAKTEKIFQIDYDRGG